MTTENKDDSYDEGIIDEPEQEEVKYYSNIGGRRYI